jgi:hypothetical protein
LEKYLNTKKADECCPRFDPSPWDGKTHLWNQKRFVKDRVHSFLHLPLNFGAVMKRNSEAIEAANATSEPTIILSDENSLWGADVYIEATKDMPSKQMASISGTFLSKVFEGPYSNSKNWAVDMKAYVAGENKQIKKLYCYYTTCPKCAKKYGKNYVVLLAQI